MAERNLGIRLKELFKKSPEGRGEYSVHEIAKQAREVELNAMDFGVLGTDKLIPDAPDKKSTKLPHLLRYSPTILKHFETLRNILAEPKEFKIVDRVGMSWTDDVPDGDVIFRMEGKNPVYYFTHHLTSPYLNAWSAAISTYLSGEPYLCVAILQNNEKMSGLWQSVYSFSDHSEVSENNVAMSNLYPERHMALQFWFSPTKLTPNDFLEKFPSSQVVRDHLKLVGEKTDSGFRQIILHFEGKKYAEKELRDRIWRDDLPDIYAALLNKRGDFDFSIVEIGTAILGGKKHYVYTGSETARVHVKEESKVKNVSLQFAKQTFG